MCLDWITISLRVFIWFSDSPMGFRMIFSLSHGFPRIFPWFSTGFTCFSHVKKIAPGSIHCTEIQSARDTQRLWPMDHTFGGAPDPQFGFSVQLVNIAPSSLWFSGFCGLEKLFHILGSSSSRLTFIFFRGVESTNQFLLVIFVELVTMVYKASYNLGAPSL